MYQFFYTLGPNFILDLVPQTGVQAFHPKLNVTLSRIVISTSQGPTYIQVRLTGNKNYLYIYQNYFIFISILIYFHLDLV